MASSSTSSSDAGRLRFTFVVLAALLGVLVVELGVRRAAADDSQWVDELNTAPVDDGVFVLGNSMFQTGVDMDLLGRLTGEQVAFDYHNGHYTSLWYLIADLAAPQFDVDPDVVVWGFRPYYAADPAFRQNKIVDNDRFEPGDLEYQRLTTVEDAPDVGFGAQAAEAVADRSMLFERRDDVFDRITGTVTDAGVDVLGAVRPDATAGFRAEYEAGELTVADEFLREVTGGEVQRTEELVVDGVGDFVRGPKTPFGDGFIPRIAEKFRDADVPQLVVIWRPVAAVDGSDVSDQQQFVDDAIAWFEANDVPYLDLFADDRVRAEFFASGDHYNQEGRIVITEILAERLNELR